MIETHKTGYIKPEPSINTQKPYRQGHLDSLCGIYAVVNACRHAMSTLMPKRKLNSQQLFVSLVKGLHAKNRFSKMTCYGTGMKDHKLVLALASKYLLDKHALSLTISRPVKGLGTPTVAQVFKLLRNHLESPGSAALLEFENHHYCHWTVVRQVQNRQVYFFDSCGMKQRSTKDFRIKPRSDAKLTKKLAFPKSGLVFLQISNEQKAMRRGGLKSRSDATGMPVAQEI